jgi:hypothetical protein
VIGVNLRVIERAGSSSLVEIGKYFYLDGDSGGVGPNRAVTARLFLRVSSATRRRLARSIRQPDTKSPLI